MGIKEIIEGWGRGGREGKNRIGFEGGNGKE